jgi:hypothetical protein
MSIQIYERPHNGRCSRYHLDQQRKPFSVREYLRASASSIVPQLLNYELGFSISNPAFNQIAEPGRPLKSPPPPDA